MKRSKFIKILTASALAPAAAVKALGKKEHTEGPTITFGKPPKTYEWRPGKPRGMTDYCSRRWGRWEPEVFDFWESTDGGISYKIIL